MSAQHNTIQEAFWAGDFGNHYIDRNGGDVMVRSNVALFSRILSRTGPLSSVLELGANIGLNLRAIRSLSPATRLGAVEINAKAFAILQQLEGVEAVHGSLLAEADDGLWDLTFTKTVLIHIAPEQLPRAYDRLYNASRRFVLLVEYYNPTPTEVHYRGHSERLFKRDFAGEMMQRFPDLSLVDYGFVYHGDAFPQDDVTWFLLRKP